MIRVNLSRVSSNFKNSLKNMKDKVTEIGCEISGKAFVEGESTGFGYCEGEESKLLN